MNNFWLGVDRVLARASPEGASLHGLGPLFAHRLCERGAAVPEPVAFERKMAVAAMLSVRPLLERVRASCEGDLVLMKGPEIAIRYPGEARAFGDIDLLVSDPRRVHTELLDAGFLESGSPELFHRIHHLRPLRWPGLPLAVEIHDRPKWPAGFAAPSAAEILRSAVPSGLRVGGILAPEEGQHSLLVAAHAWAHEPLRILRDLVDVRCLAVSTDKLAVDQTARVWGVAKLWRTTTEVAEAVMAGSTTSMLLRAWTRHLVDIRERTVFENHLQSWISGYWALPPGAAVANTARAVVQDFTPVPEESWAQKTSRTLKAIGDAMIPRSQHNRRLGESATRGRGRNAPDEEAADQCPETTRES
jgi:hypothetical protein